MTRDSYTVICCTFEVDKKALILLRLDFLTFLQIVMKEAKEKLF